MGGWVSNSPAPPGGEIFVGGWVPQITPQPPSLVKKNPVGQAVRLSSWAQSHCGRQLQPKSVLWESLSAFRMRWCLSQAPSGSTSTHWSNTPMWTCGPRCRCVCAEVGNGAVGHIKTCKLPQPTCGACSRCTARPVPIIGLNPRVLTALAFLGAFRGRGFAAGRVTGARTC